jgi:hypothetical protein
VTSPSATRKSTEAAPGPSITLQPPAAILGAAGGGLVDGGVVGGVTAPPPGGTPGSIGVGVGVPEVGGMTPGAPASAPPAGGAPAGGGGAGRPGTAGGSSLGVPHQPQRSAGSLIDAGRAGPTIFHLLARSWLGRKLVSALFPLNPEYCEISLV